MDFRQDTREDIPEEHSMCCCGTMECERGNTTPDPLYMPVEEKPDFLGPWYKKTRIVSCPDIIVSGTTN